MVLPILAIKTIAELAFTAIPMVERLIRGRGRGPEKKEAAREFILEEIQTVLNGPNKENLPDFANFDWVGAIRDWSMLVTLGDNVIDATVALLNGLAKYNRSPEGPVEASRIQTVN